MFNIYIYIYIFLFIYIYIYIYQIYIYIHIYIDICYILSETRHLQVIFKQKLLRMVCTCILKTELFQLLPLLICIYNCYL